LFSCDLDSEENDMENLDNLSPNVSHATPLMPTPKTYDFININKEHQALRNEDCNNYLSKLQFEIYKNSNREGEEFKGV